MENLYYKIWVDAIYLERKNNEKYRNWKVHTMIPITMMQFVNILTLSLLLNVFKINFIIDLFDFLPEYKFDVYLSAFIVLILFALINYLLIFRKHRYELLQTKYNNKNGKLYKGYVLFSLGIFIVPVAVGKIIYELFM